MSNADIAQPLRQLIARFRAWDDALRRGTAGESSSHLPSTRERGEILDELCSLAGTPGAVGRSPADEPRPAFFALFFGQRAPAKPAELAGELLRGYEALCDRDLPFAVSSVLFRQYSALKRSSHVTPLPDMPRAPALRDSAPEPPSLLLERAAH